MKQCSFIVFDRFLYLKNIRKLKKISFKVLDKKTGEDVTFKFKKYKFDNILEYIEKNKNKHDYEVISFQFERTQLGLLLKYITQIIIVIFIHIFVYFYLPTKSQTNSDNNKIENKVTTNIFIFIFYVLYIFYFIFSGLQIKYGLTDMRKVSSLMKASNLLYNMTYKIYRQIPFLFELKNFIDWTFTKTSLDLWKWLKLEEIISLLYREFCIDKNTYDIINKKIEGDDKGLISAFEVYAVTKDHNEFIETLRLIADLNENYKGCFYHLINLSNFNLSQKDKLISLYKERNETLFVILKNFDNNEDKDKALLEMKNLVKKTK